MSFQSLIPRFVGCIALPPIVVDLSLWLSFSVLRVYVNIFYFMKRKKKSV